MASPTRTGVAKAGTSNARKVECSKSKHHGFHPEDEECSYCDPAPVDTHSVDAYAAGWAWLNSFSADLPIVTKPRGLTYASGAGAGVPQKQYQKVAGVDGQVTWRVKP